jgi:hypothetical protein
MKLICKCGNVEDIITNIQAQNFLFKDCGDGTYALVCKKCNEVVYIPKMIKQL